MTEFYKVIDDGYVVGFGTNGNDSVTEIDEEEYAALMAFVQTRPTAPDGYAYVIRDNPREWELVELPPEPPEELTDAEALSILLGGDGE